MKKVYLFTVLSLLMVISVQGQSNIKNCKTLSGNAFQQKLAGIQHKPNEFLKLQSATALSHVYCLTGNQVARAARIFKTDQDRLIFTKTAFHNMVNRRNIYLAYGTFRQQQFRQQLKQYVKTSYHKANSETWCTWGKRFGHFGDCGSNGHNKDELDWCKCGYRAGHCGVCNGDKQWCGCGKSARHTDNCYPRDNTGPGNRGDHKGRYVMSSRTFSRLLYRIKKEQADSKKLYIIKKIIQQANNMLMVRQITFLAKELRTDHYKMDFFKHVYECTEDKKNYNKLVNEFSASNNRRAFLHYARSKQTK